MKTFIIIEDWANDFDKGIEVKGCYASYFEARAELEKLVEQAKKDNPQYDTLEPTDDGWVGYKFGEWEQNHENIFIQEKDLNYKFYQAEMNAFDFMKGWHSLQEWADFGFNKVVFEDNEYWDGRLNGDEDIYEDVDDLEYDYYEHDEDGYMVIYLRKGEK